MKALTLTQPWATLIAIGAKRIETRSWRTDYCGPIAIHAAKGLADFPNEAAMWDLALSEPFRAALTEGGYGNPGRLPRGCVVAVAFLAGCRFVEGFRANQPHRFTDGYTASTAEWWLTEQEAAFGDYTPGRYAWLLADVRRLDEPIPARGALGLWDWTPPAGLLGSEATT